MSEPPVTKDAIRWRYRSTNDSEFAYGRFRCFDITIRDCDGDMTRWDIKRGDQYLASGEVPDARDVPYHMERATDLAVQVLGYLWAAVELNDFVANELPKLKAQGLA